MNKSRTRASQPARPRPLASTPALHASTVDGDALQRLAIEGRRTSDALRSVLGAGNRAVQRLVSAPAEESELFNVPDVNLPAPGGGESIPDEVRSKMEGAFGQDFSDVRVHTSSAPASIDALAYTQGHDIHFSPGQFNPATTGGQEALGHELAHVVQQRSGRVASPEGPGAPVNAQAALEAEADALGRQAARTDVSNNLASTVARDSAAPTEESAQRIAAPVQREGRSRRGSVAALEEMQLVSSRRGMFEGGGAAMASPTAAPSPGAPSAAVAPPSAEPAADAAAITEAPGGAAAVAEAVPETDESGVPEGADEVEEAMGSDMAAAAAAASELASTVGADEALATIAEGGESEETEGEESPASGSAITSAPSTPTGIASALGLPTPVPTPETEIAATTPGSSTPAAPPSASTAASAPAATTPMVVEESSADGDNWWDAPAPSRVSRDVPDSYADTAGLGMTAGGAVSSATGGASTFSGMVGASTFDTGQVSNIAGAPGGLLGAGAGLVEAAGASRAAHLSGGGAQAVDAARATSALTGAAASTASAASSIEAARLTSQTGNLTSMGSGANAVMTGAGTAAAGLSVATGSIDVIRGVGGAVLADSRQRQLEARAQDESFGDARARSAAAATAETQRQAFWDSTATATKGAITVAGGAILLALGLSNPIGLGLLAGAAIAGGAYALYKWFRGRKENKNIKGGVSEKQAKMELAVTLFESGIKDAVPEYRQILKDLGFKAKKVDAGVAGGITASDILKKIS